MENDNATRDTRPMWEECQATDDTELRELVFIEALRRRCARERTAVDATIRSLFALVAQVPDGWRLVDCLDTEIGALVEAERMAALEIAPKLKKRMPNDALEGVVEELVG